MKKNLTLIIALLFSSIMVTKSAVFVDTLLVCSSGEHRLLMYVPDDYDASQKYPLVLGLQPCNGTTTKSYLDGLKPIADQLKMIVVVPDNFAKGGWIADANMDIITVSIDSAMAQYNIDEKLVYFTGMSCNGEVALRQGLKKIYPFKGIFPWAPYMASVNPAVIDLNSDMPITVAVGTKEEMAYKPILNLYDSLKNHGANVNLVLVPGITHTFDFPDFGNEMIHSLKYLNDTNLISINYSETILVNFEMMDTDSEKELKFKVSHKLNKELVVNSLSSNIAIINDPEITYNTADSTVTLKFAPLAGKKGEVVIVLEAQEKDGMAIEQVTFKVKVTLAPTTDITAASALISKFVLYPNPASDVINLKCEEQNVSVQIIDVNGKVVLKTNSSNNTPINISSLKNGIYFINIKGEKFSSNEKFAVCK